MDRRAHIWVAGLLPSYEQGLEALGHNAVISNEQPVEPLVGDSPVIESCLQRHGPKATIPSHPDADLSGEQLARVAQQSNLFLGRYCSLAATMDA